MPEDKNKPVFDEQTLAKLLEAAFVLQEHGHELRKQDAGTALKPDAARVKQIQASKPERDVQSLEPLPPRSSPRPPSRGQNYSSALAEIVETQHEIEVRGLKSQDALSLIANRLIGISGARGAAIAVVKRNSVSYRIVAGIGTLPRGSEVPFEKALCASALRSGEVFTCADINPQLDGGVGECRRRGIASLIIVPVIVAPAIIAPAIMAPVVDESKVAGALEVYYSEPRSFTEQDLHTCQLIAGMIGEVLTAENRVLGSAVSSGGSAVPSGDSAVASRDREVRFDQMRGTIGDREQASILSGSQAASAGSAASAASVFCSSCGQQLLGEEQFCVECGAPRPKIPAPTSMPNKAVPYWLEIRKKEAQVPVLEPPAKLLSDTPRPNASRVAPGEHPASEAGSLEGLEAGTIREIEAMERAMAAETGETETDHARDVQAESVSVELDGHGEEPPPAPDWSSALSARQFLEQISGENRKNAIVQFWNSRRGDVYLAIAIIIVISVVGLGLRSSRPAKATPPPATTAASHKAAQPDLSTFDRVLIGLGLAEAPPPPEEKGNPATQVWIDLHTGLYYCPGNDLYGKTPNGKYATQRDAELDQYQPAYRKTCE